METLKSNLVNVTEVLCNAFRRWSPTKSVLAVATAHLALLFGAPLGLVIPVFCAVALFEATRIGLVLSLSLKNLF